MGVAGWLEQKSKDATKEGSSLVEHLTHMFPVTQELRAQMLLKVPWPPTHPYLPLLRVPAHKTKGFVHISMLHFGEKGLHGKGLYAADASLWLRHLEWPLNIRRLDIVPVQTPGANQTPVIGGSGGELGVFGYGADGAMVNSTILFALSAVVLFAIESDTAVPEEWVKKLQNIPATYAKHDNRASRLVTAMVTSAVNQKVNRTMDDPLILSKELSRRGVDCCPQSSVRSVVRLYKARTMGSPTLTMKRNTEEATIRLMDRAKMCEDSVSGLTRITLKAGWNGPLSADSILAPRMVMGACLVDSSNPTWNQFAVQTAEGQTTTLAHVETLLDKELATGSALTQWTQEGLDELCAVFGLWQKINRGLLPALLLAPKVINDLHEQIQDRGALFSCPCRRSVDRTTSRLRR